MLVLKDSILGLNTILELKHVEKLNDQLVELKDRKET